MKPENFTTFQRCRLRSNYSLYLACIKRGETEARTEHYSPPFIHLTKPGVDGIWRLVAFDRKGRAYGFYADENGKLRFEWELLKNLKDRFALT